MLSKMLTDHLRSLDSGNDNLGAEGFIVAQFVKRGQKYALLGSGCFGRRFRRTVVPLLDRSEDGVDDRANDMIGGFVRKFAC